MRSSETALDIEELLAISHAYGEHLGHIQGAGGNTSVKHADGYMAIKASGTTLREMTASDGHVAVPHGPIAQFYSGRSSAAESEFKSLLGSLERRGDGRPSMECGFHALIPERVVLHSHSARALVLGGAAGAPQLSAVVEEKLAAEGLSFAFVPYAAPGVPLSFLIAGALAERRQPSVFLLENHGLIVAGPTAPEVLRRYAVVDSILSELIPTEPPKILEEGLVSLAEEELVRMGSALGVNAVVPDQVVYFPEPGSFAYRKNVIHALPELSSKERGQLEVLLLVEYAERAWRESGRKPRYLTIEERSEILGLDSEKHRQAMMNQGAE